MGLFNWLKKLFGKSEVTDTVPFYDIDAGRVVQIPRCELSSNAIQVQVQGIDEPVWVLADKLRQGPVQHDPFSEDVLDHVRHIQIAFSEHRDLTLEEWEDGFRRDASPEKEIALWSYAADIYLHFSDNETSPERRADIYRCILTCMVTGPESVWDVLRPQILDRTEAEKIVNSFYNKDRT